MPCGDCRKPNHRASPRPAETWNPQVTLRFRWRVGPTNTPLSHARDAAHASTRGRNAAKVILASVNFVCATSTCLFPPTIICSKTEAVGRFSMCYNYWIKSSSEATRSRLLSNSLACGSAASTERITGKQLGARTEVSTAQLANPQCDDGWYGSAGPTLRHTGVTRYRLQNALLSA